MAVIAIVWTAVVVSQAGEFSDIVMTDSALYTPARLYADLDSLEHRYPDWIKVTCRDTTVQGNPIPVVWFGCRDFETPSVMVQASMHAREYMSSQLVMALLERYAFHCQNDSTIGGYDVRDLFSRVHFTILPLVNPDGVDIAQRGSRAARDYATRRWLMERADSGKVYERFKANSRGVDLNRNFPEGFGRAANALSHRAFAHFPGPKPLSEVESFMMMRVAWSRDYDLFLNYHCCGNLLYYGSHNALGRVNDKASHFAGLIMETTGYPMVGPDNIPANGSWVDEVETLFEKPGVTVETGTQTPVPFDEFPSIFSRNLLVWAKIAAAIDHPHHPDR